MYHNRPMEKRDAWMGSSTHASQIFNRLFYMILWYQILSVIIEVLNKSNNHEAAIRLQLSEKPNQSLTHYTSQPVLKHSKTKTNTKVIVWLLSTLNRKPLLKSSLYQAVFLPSLKDCSLHMHVLFRGSIFSLEMKRDVTIQIYVPDKVDFSLVISPSDHLPVCLYWAVFFPGFTPMVRLIRHTVLENSSAEK